MIFRINFSISIYVSNLLGLFVGANVRPLARTCCSISVRDFWLRLKIPLSPFLCALCLNPAFLPLFFLIITSFFPVVFPHCGCVSVNLCLAGGTDCDSVPLFLCSFLSPFDVMLPIPPVVLCCSAILCVLPLKKENPIFFYSLFQSFLVYRCFEIA
ncbi:hypothetical protein XELAEV_18005639mg [Xenopus laevis]|uniref:Uncharacterized protein n=1 Tax=Xenopus laevis TaxID=8355 RepID=A0A974I3J7_XENLA|nr:hypothetical protein XELAEV_18005639mg [Xenopus laevis]